MIGARPGMIGGAHLFPATEQILDAAHPLSSFEMLRSSHRSPTFEPKEPPFALSP